MSIHHIPTKGRGLVTWMGDGTWQLTPRGTWDCTGCGKRGTASILNVADQHAQACTHTPRTTR